MTRRFATIAAALTAAGACAVTGWGAAAHADRGHHRAYQLVESAALPASTEPAGTSTTGVHLADVDRDGDLDLFVAEGTAGLDPRPNQLLLNDGHGHFTDVSATHLPAAIANSTRADFADVDGDGDLDAIVANVGREQLLLNDGRGHFADGSAQLPPAPSIFVDISANAQFADVDGDRCVDILVSNENPFNPSPTGGAQNFLWLNTRSGGRCAGVFVDATAARLPAATDQTAAILPGDVDRDGDVDLVVLNRGQERVLINDGHGVFTDATAARFPVTTDSTRSGALVDLDRDGWLDLVTSNSRNQPPQVYWNDRRGGFTLGSFGYTPAPDETDTELVVADLDRDRRPEIFIANAGRFDAGHGFEGGADHLFEVQRDRSIVEVTAAHAVFPAGQASTAAAIGDVDRDGDLDLVVAGTGDGELGRERVFLQQRDHGDDCDDDRGDDRDDDRDD